MLDFHENIVLPLTMCELISQVQKLGSGDTLSKIDEYFNMFNTTNPTTGVSVQTHKTLLSRLLFKFNFGQIV